MIEERLILRREDFLNLRESRNHPQRASGIIVAVNCGGIIYSSGVFPRSSERSFFESIKGVDCNEILGNFNSIVIPYMVGDSKDAFAEILEIAHKSSGLIDEFCFVRERQTGFYTPANNYGIITLQSIPYSVAGEKRIDSNIIRVLEEQNKELTNLLSCDLTVECH